MTISPDKKDFFTIFNILGKLLLGLSVFMVIPLIVALIYKEANPTYDFAIAICISAILGFVLSGFFPLTNT